ARQGQGPHPSAVVRARSQHDALPRLARQGPGSAMNRGAHVSRRPQGATSTGWYRRGSVRSQSFGGGSTEKLYGRRPKTIKYKTSPGESERFSPSEEPRKRR